MPLITEIDFNTKREDFMNKILKQYIKARQNQLPSSKALAARLIRYLNQHPMAQSILTKEEMNYVHQASIEAAESAK